MSCIASSIMLRTRRPSGLRDFIFAFRTKTSLKAAWRNISVACIASQPPRAALPLHFPRTSVGRRASLGQGRRRQQTRSILRCACFPAQSTFSSNRRTFPDSLRSDTTQKPWWRRPLPAECTFAAPPAAVVPRFRTFSRSFRPFHHRVHPSERRSDRVRKPMHPCILKRGE